MRLKRNKGDHWGGRVRFGKWGGSGGELKHDMRPIEFTGGIRGEDSCSPLGRGVKGKMMKERRTGNQEIVKEESEKKS